MSAIAATGLLMMWKSPFNYELFIDDNYGLFIDGNYGLFIDENVNNVYVHSCLSSMYIPVCAKDGSLCT